MITKDRDGMYNFSSEEKCIEKAENRMKKIKFIYEDWSSSELRHSYKGKSTGEFKISPSPTPTSRNREAISCSQR